MVAATYARANVRQTLICQTLPSELTPKQFRDLTGLSPLQISRRTGYTFGTLKRYFAAPSSARYLEPPLHVCTNLANLYRLMVLSGEKEHES